MTVLKACFLLGKKRILNSPRESIFDAVTPFPNRDSGNFPIILKNKMRIDESSRFAGTDLLESTSAEVLGSLKTHSAYASFTHRHQTQDPKLQDPKLQGRTNQVSKLAPDQLGKIAAYKSWDQTPARCKSDLSQQMGDASAWSQDARGGAFEGQSAAMCQKGGLRPNLSPSRSSALVQPASHPKTGGLP